MTPLLSDASALYVGAEPVVGVYAGSEQVWPVSSGDADAAAFIAAAGITDETQQAAVQALTVALKDAGVWQKLDALYPFVGGTEDSHKWNLIDPRDTDAAYRLSFFGNWNHSGNGASPDNSTAYADTHFEDDTVSGWVTDCAFGFYSRQDTAVGYSYDMGLAASNDIPATVCIARYGNSRFYACVGSSGYPYTDSLDGRGFFVTDKTGTNQRGFKNGTKVVNATESSLPPVGISMYVGACHKPGQMAYPGQKQHALTFIGAHLDDTEQADLYTAVQAFQTTLGRQV